MISLCRLLLCLVATLHVCLAQSDVLYNGCNVEDYYGDLLTSSGSLREDVTREELESLLKSTHRKVLPYTGSNNRDDVWRALIDLDVGDSDPDSVRLIYRQEDSPAWPHGTANTWNREHLWPKSRGVGYKGADFTDVHHLRPADWNVNAARSNLYFGECGIAEPEAECEIPAHGEAALDTASDSTIFLPPERVRGDIARAILYMDVRYSSPPDDNLIVTDCPSDEEQANSYQLAYKSALLEWHILDEVTDAERQRNQRACERWQGNRNPFVDFPQLAKRLFGDPQTPLGDGLGYPCDDTTLNPAPVPAPLPPTPTMMQCKDLETGDVMFVAVNSDQPDLVALVALKDLQEGLFLYLTDNAYTGSGFRTNEGTIVLRVPSPGIRAGTVFGYGESSTGLKHYGDWEPVKGQFQLSASGDAILLYCRDDPEKETPMRFLSGLDYSGEGWKEPNLPPEDYGSAQSALPGKLKGATIALPHLDNYRYAGSSSAGSLQELQSLLSDPNQWRGSNTVASLPAVSTGFSLPSTSGGGPSPGDVMVVAMNSENPDMVALVALDNLEGGLELYMTDNAWTGNGFQTNEGTVKLTLPSSGINAGTIFGYGSNLSHGKDWTGTGGKFALAQNGDAIFVYTQNEDGPIQHLCAFSYNGGWKEAGTDSYGSDESALPESLRSVGSIRLPHKDNYVYTGSFSGDKASLQAELQKEANWRGSNTDPVDAPTTRFSLSSTSSGGRNFWGRSSWHFQLLALSLLKAFAA